MYNIHFDCDHLWVGGVKSIGKQGYMLLLIIIVSIISYILFSRWSVFYLLESLAVQKDHTPTLLLEIRSSVNRLVDVGDEMTRTMLLFTFFFTSLTTEGKLFLRLWITKWCFLCFEKHLCKASTCFVSATDDDTYIWEVTSHRHTVGTSVKTLGKNMEGDSKHILPDCGKCGLSPSQ